MLDTYFLSLRKPGYQPVCWMAFFLLSFVIALHSGATAYDGKLFLYSMSHGTLAILLGLLEKIQGRNCLVAKGATGKSPEANRFFLCLWALFIFFMYKLIDT